MFVITNDEVLKYKDLVCYFSVKYSKMTKVPYKDIESMAWEGLLNAYNTFNSKAGAAFKTYASTCIKNNICLRLMQESRLVKITEYDRNKYIRKHGNPPYQTIFSLSNSNIDDDSATGFTANENFLYKKETLDLYDSIDRQVSKSNDMKYFYKRLEKHFPEHYCDIFYSAFGLKNKKTEQLKNIAARHNITLPRASLIKKRIITYIKNSKELSDIIYDYIIN